MSQEEIKAKLLEIDGYINSLRRILNLCYIDKVESCGVEITLSDTFKTSIKDGARTFCDNISTLMTDIRGLIP